MSTSCQKRPVMEKICNIIGNVKPKIDSCHPGLWLDKFAMPDKQEIQYEELKYICRFNNKAKQEYGGELFKEVCSSRERIFRTLRENGLRFTAQTTGPFILHLARASALENAGICLHPVYGFAYIPGTAIKGMAHAFACEVWLPTRSDKQIAWRQICEVFGWATSPWLGDLAKNLAKKCECDITAPGGESSGAVIFHEAWPLMWPKLICDIVNNHHPKYYGATQKELKEKPDEFASGDWENPKPVYFLAVASGEEFDFPLSLRPVAALSNSRSAFESPDDVLKLACQWLLGALEHRGAGAKTSAGYGRFKLVKEPDNYTKLKEETENIWKDAKKDGHFCEETFTLELVTPAFLAGADQKAEDCDLRPATLRGHLRWWWRTIHSGYLNVATLKKLEDAIWGDTKKSGIITIALTVENKKAPDEFNQKPNSGYYFIAYGMAGRYFLPQGASWKLSIQTRTTVFNDCDISKETAMTQAKMALFLLCYYGGVGARCRKGFGSLTMPENLQSFSVQKSLEQTKKTLTEIKLDTNNEETTQYALGSCIEQDYTVPANVVDVAIESFGKIYKEFTKEKKGDPNLAVLGIPRKNISKERYASIVHFHFDLAEESRYILRMIGFPVQMDNISADESKKFIEEFKIKLKSISTSNKIKHSGGNYV